MKPTRLPAELELLVANNLSCHDPAVKLSPAVALKVATVDKTAGFGFNQNVAHGILSKIVAQGLVDNLRGVSKVFNFAIKMCYRYRNRAVHFQTPFWFWLSKTAGLVIVYLSFAF
jgi:hypothetical protein